MKAHLAQVFESINGQSRNRQIEMLVDTLQNENLLLKRNLQAKESEISDLRERIGNLEAHLQEMTGVDGLTGLPNQQSFKEHLCRSVKRALRLGYSLSLLILDIDRLPEIDVAHGTEVSDLILSKVAQILRNSVREVDMAARWSESQLIAVLHETDAEGASMVAERVRKKACSLDVFDPKSGQAVQVSVFLAVAGYLPHNGEANDILETVCQALATAKTRGCDRVVVSKA
jgi:diguanylate cyclase (GGDEF)-like protein